MALSHARIASSRTSVRTSTRGQRGRGTAPAAGRVKRTTQIHAVDVVAGVEASLRSGGKGAVGVSATGVGAVEGASTATGSSPSCRIPEWASATTVAQHNVRTRKTPHEIGVTVARNCRRRLRKPSTALTVDHRALRCQTSVARRNRRAVRLCVVHLISEAGKGRQAVGAGARNPCRGAGGRWSSRLARAVRRTCRPDRLIDGRPGRRPDHPKQAEKYQRDGITRGSLAVSRDGDGPEVLARPRFEPAARGGLRS